ncbi:MAG TPA: cadmium-translocating P-type ATPase, partial [Thermopetrobacter sp.]|nr:cadmium-translocating P-type ATPase [Thermopetrobacter sp.]
CVQPGEIGRWVRRLDDGAFELNLIAPAISTAQCIRTIEKGLAAIPAVTHARVNFSLKQIRVRWREEDFDPQTVMDELERLGYPARPFDPEDSGFAMDDATANRLLKALAVAGFASGNIMMFSVSVWAGATDATRDMLHWFSALIAVPAVIYAGQPFFRPAFAALQSARLNMDVPISLAVISATLLSLYQVATSQAHAYFEAAVMLLFFLLIGRYLDHRVRARARSAVSQLATLAAEGALVIDETGKRRYYAMADLKPGMVVQVAAGERIPVDGEVVEGTSDVDVALITGETTPQPVGEGDMVYAGAMNLTGPLRIRLTASGDDTFLAEITRLMKAAEESKSKQMQLADKLAGWYAPVVHVLAALTLAGWLYATDFDWPQSLFVAISVLIITCPCALALAVPAVQVVAAGRLFRHGVMVKDGAALQRLAEVDTVIFDKTGTLTMGRPRLKEHTPASTDALAVAAALASRSGHPLSRALAVALSERGITPAEVRDITEHPGKGLTGAWRGRAVKLGSLAFCGVEDDGAGLPRLALAIDGAQPVVFSFTDALRPDAAETIAALRAWGLRVEIASGDREGPVEAVAKQLGISDWHAGWTPQQKLAYVEGLARAGRKVLMVGDGINDAPALAAGHASMAPASASDIGRTAADFVFTNPSLGAV